MPTLPADLRRNLERTIVDAREIAETGARAALTQLAVDRAKPDKHMSDADRRLRNHLRARARQLGDQIKSNDEHQIDHLTRECAYEHWHRMLFARFLAENNLLIEPEQRVAISLDECRELAAEAKTDLWTLASQYAQKMLPQIFRPDDPLLAVALPREHQLKLEELLNALVSEVFTASDSLGWVYQFWQTENKRRVNESEVKIGADELPAVTQLFTEDYMVDFLLDNTLGAWWAGKMILANPSLAEAENEAAMREAVALPNVPWKYLRFRKVEAQNIAERAENVKKEGFDFEKPSAPAVLSVVKEGSWVPAAGVFEGWPKTAAELKIIDPCCGSGHFLVAILERLTAIRMKEEGLPIEKAIRAVIAENLHGLEIDPRCTQIAAFAVALAAWKAAPLSIAEPLPAMRIACCGLELGCTRKEWITLIKNQGFLLGQFYDLFKNARTLGSLINPGEHIRSAPGVATIETFDKEIIAALEKQRGKDDFESTELGVTAHGLAEAYRLLSSKYHLVATNVPYLLRRKHSQPLLEFCDLEYPDGNNDLATVFLERITRFTPRGGTVVAVIPQNALLLGSYKKLRTRLLASLEWNIVAALGSGAFETIGGEVVNVSLVNVTVGAGNDIHTMAAIDVAEQVSITVKATMLLSAPLLRLNQRTQLNNPDSRIIIEQPHNQRLLCSIANAYQGIVSGDDPKLRRTHWEIMCLEHIWKPLQSTCEVTQDYSGRDSVIRWVDEGYELARRQGLPAWKKRGISVRQMGALSATIYSGDIFDVNAASIIPHCENDMVPIWAFCNSTSFQDEVRKIDCSIKVTNSTLVKVPFNLAHWQEVAAEKYPDGLPKPYSSDPTQWLFNGHPVESDNVLHVAVARMLGYRWPRQTGSSFPDCHALGPDGLEEFADDDGVVGIPAIRGEDSAADRLRQLLAKAYGKKWKPSMETELIAATGSSAHDLDEWLRNDFFEQHCALFHHRPFIWHIWDGRKRDGFHALVHYHRLAEAGGKGKRLIDKLAHSYLNDWIKRQQDGIKHDEGGADARLEAALELQRKLAAISEGEPPYDIFVRWKPLAQQPIGWDPDINDGVRLNIRPFVNAGVLRSKKLNVKWTKDRGKEPKRAKDQYPWFWGWDEETKDFTGGKTFDGNRWNDCHYSLDFKSAVRKKDGIEK